MAHMQNIDAASFWLDVAQWIVMLLLMIWGYINRRHSAHVDELNAVKRELANAQQELERIEARMGTMLTHQDLTSLRERIEEVHAGQQKLAGHLEGIARAVDLMSQHLLSQNR